MKPTVAVFPVYHVILPVSTLLLPSLLQERLQADEVIHTLDTQSVWGQGFNINPKDEL